jgi:hypothetical protein
VVAHALVLAHILQFKSVEGVDHFGLALQQNVETVCLEREFLLVLLHLVQVQAVGFDESDDILGLFVLHESALLGHDWVVQGFQSLLNGLYLLTLVKLHLIVVVLVTGVILNECPYEFSLLLNVNHIELRLPGHQHDLLLRLVLVDLSHIVSNSED